MGSGTFDVGTIMGGKTMFDLNQEIAKWRSNLTQSETLSKSDVDELESHLREEIESLKSAKLSDEEAFMIAAHRLGSPEGLADEFAKIGWDSALRYRVSWMITGILAYLLAMQFSALLQKAFIWLASVKEIRGNSLGLGFVVLASNVVLLGVVLSLCYFLWYYAQRSNRFRKWTRQLTTRPILLFIILVFLVVELAAQIALPVVAYRVLGSSQYGQAAQVFAWTRLAWSILLPVILVVALIKLGAANSRESQTE
jgi:hypothetical protein